MEAVSLDDCMPDFRHLSQLKSQIGNILQKSQQDGTCCTDSLTVELPRQNSFDRLAFPFGLEALSKYGDGQTHKQMTFVGFFGNQGDHRTPDVTQKIFALDEALMPELQNYPGLMCHSCSCLGIDGHNSDWFNLILVQSPEVIDAWLSGKTHNEAVRYASYPYFLHISWNLVSLSEQHILKPKHNLEHLRHNQLNVNFINT